MKRLILTSLSGAGLMRPEHAIPVIYFCFRFVWDRLPSAEELATYVGPRPPDHPPGEHWSTFVGRRLEDRKDLSLLEFCALYDVIELWFDPSPNDQLQLIWLLDCFRSDPATAAKLRLRHVDFDLVAMSYAGPEEKDVHEVEITRADLELAGTAWQSYRSTTPERCVDLIRKDLSAFPLLRPALIDLLEELPSGTTGLGATEMRILDLIANGYASANTLFHRTTLRQTRVFNEMEIGSLLEGLAHGPWPAVAGLDDELRTLAREKFRDRLTAYQRSRLSLTEFGKAIVAHKEDFSHHNPIDRWWGGTRLANDNLWRWNPTLIKP